MEEETGRVGCVIALLMLIGLIVIIGLDWLITCGIIKLVCLCFGWTFTWAKATGIWLIISMIEGALGSIKLKG